MDCVDVFEEYEYEEFHEVVSHTVEVQAESMKRGMNDATVYRRTNMTRWTEDFIGQAAEMAFCRKYLKVPWPKYINTFHNLPDLTHNGNEYEVRATPLFYGGLVVRDNDVLDRIFVLLVGDIQREDKQDRLQWGGRRLYLPGWLYGHEVVQEKNQWNPENRRPAWRAPQSDLRSMNTLPR